MNELATTEQSKLQECEQQIEAGMTTFMEVGTALLEIRDSRLYRAEYSTFAEYCQKRWNFTKGRATQLIQAADVSKMVTNVTIPNEATARELAKVAPEKRQDVAEKAAKSGKLTAKSIKEAAEPEPEHEPETHIKTATEEISQGQLDADDQTGNELKDAPFEQPPESYQPRTIGLHEGIKFVATFCDMMARMNQETLQWISVQGVDKIKLRSVQEQREILKQNENT